MAGYIAVWDESRVVDYDDKSEVQEGVLRNKSGDEPRVFDKDEVIDAVKNSLLDEADKKDLLRELGKEPVDFPVSGSFEEAIESLDEVSYL